MIVAAERGGGSIWRDEVDPLFRSVLGRVVTEEKQSWCCGVANEYFHITEHNISNTQRQSQIGIEHHMS